MTLSGLITEVNTLRPNQFSNDIKTGWVNEIEAKAVKDVINRAQGNDEEFDPYVYQSDQSTVLLIPDTHKDVYITFLFAKIDYTQNEIDRYNADSVMHAGAWREYAAEYRREHLPK